MNYTASFTEESKPTFKNWLTLVVLSSSLMIIIIDASIVNVTIQAIRTDFNASLRDLDWISAAYSLVYAALIITWGRISDAVGRKTIFIAGVTTFVLGSIITGAAPTIGVIIIGRIIQGLGAAMASPSTLSILSSTFTGKSRSVAFGVWGATAGAGGALGPLVGGFLTTNFSWRWAFYINIPIGILAVAGALLFIQESKDTTRKQTIDPLGIIFASFGLAALVFGLIEGQTYGWLTPKGSFAIGTWNWPLQNIAFAATMFIIAIVFLTAFVVYEIWLKSRGGEPIFDFSLLKFRGFRFGLITVGVVALGEFGILFVLSLYFQGVRDLTALQTGLILLPFAVGSFFTAPIAGILASRFGAKWIVTSGMTIEALSIFSISRITQTYTPLWQFIPEFLFYGIGLGLAIAQLTSVVLSDIPPQFSGAASGANNTVRQVGSAIGVAILSAILAAQITTVSQNDLAKNTILPSYIKTSVQQAFNSGLSAGDITSSVSSPVSNTGGAAPSGAGTGAPPSGKVIGQQITAIFNDATTQGTRYAALFAALFVLLGALASLSIPGAKAKATRSAKAMDLQTKEALAPEI